jgi:hypothetical protein
MSKQSKNKQTNKTTLTLTRRLKNKIKKDLDTDMRVSIANIEKHPPPQLLIWCPLHKFSKVSAILLSM